MFKIWQNEKAVPVHSLQGHGSYNLIGFSALDLTVLAAGLPLISGWFNVMDFSGVCHGQIKVSSNPVLFCIFLSLVVKNTIHIV